MDGVRSSIVRVKPYRLIEVLKMDVMDGFIKILLDEQLFFEADEQKPGRIIFMSFLPSRFFFFSFLMSCHGHSLPSSSTNPNFCIDFSSTKHIGDVLSRSENLGGCGQVFFFFFFQFFVQSFLVTNDLSMNVV